MCVLAAILADTGRITLDVTGIEGGLVKWRGEQQRQLIATVHQLAVEGRHRPGCARRIAGARDGRPGLGNRINAAFLARRGAERRAVIVVTAAIPVAVPALAIEGPCERVGMCLPGFR